MKTLRNVLLLNGVTSGATGLSLVFMSGFYAHLFETPQQAPFAGTGLFLVAYASLVLIESRRKELNANWIRFIILMDGLWTGCSVVIIGSRMFDLSILGYIMIGAVALWVALMGYLQYIGLRRVTTIN